MRPLTVDTPKPMLKISGKPILERILNDLPESVNEVILVVGYLKEKIINYFDDRFGRFKIQYVVQEDKLGTYRALELCRNLIDDNEKFIVMYADDLHGAENFRKCSEAKDCSILTLEADDPGRFGVVEVSSEGVVVGIEEKPENPKSNLVSTGVLVLDKGIFNYPARQHSNGEYYLTDSVAQMIKAGHRFQAIKSNFWLPIGYLEDLEKAEKILSVESRA